MKILRTIKTLLNKPIRVLNRRCVKAGLALAHPYDEILKSHAFLYEQSKNRFSEAEARIYAGYRGFGTETFGPHFRGSFTELEAQYEKAVAELSSLTL